ncbi:DUF5105 domain-containing protein [Lachnospiraceae bacterium 29-84]
MKNCLPALFCVCLCSSFFLLAGCGNPKIDAAGSVKAIYDLYILGDTKGITALGMETEDISAAQETYGNSLRDTIRKNFAESGQQIDEAALEELCAARKEALSKMSATAEVTAESEGKATVVIRTTYFNESSLDEEAFYTARQSAWKMDFPSLEKQQEFLMDAYTQNLIQSYQEVTPSEDTAAITVDCVIHNHIWMPANMSSFGADLAHAVTTPPGTE